MNKKEKDEISEIEIIELNVAREALIEEIEAIISYDEKLLYVEDEELRKILIHNRDDEKEHIAMLLNWLSKRDPALEKELKEKLFK
ncbi:MAG: hypothetical protein QW038_01620 [Nanopusillaceae archaeon]